MFFSFLNQHYDIIICVYWFKLISQVSDVAHGPLVYISVPTATPHRPTWMEDLFPYSEEEELEEYEYVDPDEERVLWSRTPPPPCDRADHRVCIQPRWGERFCGPPLRPLCLLCCQDDAHHPVRCLRCRNAPGCCACIWEYMRSRYNSGCPLCRYGDPGESNNPLPIARSGVGRGRGSRGRGRAGRGGSGIVTWRRGRGRPGGSVDVDTRVMGINPGTGGIIIGRRGRGRARRGRGTTMEEEEEPERWGGRRRKVRRKKTVLFRTNPLFSKRLLFVAS